MASKIVDNENKELKIEPRTGSDKSTLDWKVYGAEIAIGLVFLIITFLFFGRKLFSWLSFFDGDFWGQYGDVIGGVVGSFIAYLGIRLVVKTLQEQIKANAEIASFNDKCVQTNMINQFESNFQTVYSIYSKSLDNFKSIDGDKAGHQYLNECVKTMTEKAIVAMTDDYSSNIPKAQQAFNEFYSSNRYSAAMYFSLLYRVMQTIDEPKNIPDNYKRRYAKIVRCQLSEDELLLLRYDAMSISGAKMRSYVNRYNLLKHLPPTKMLEFPNFGNEKLSEPLRNELDSILISFTKGVKDMFILDNVSSYEYSSPNNKYVIRSLKKNDGKTLRIEIVKNNKLKESFCLDGLSESDLTKLMIAYLKELLIYSSLKEYVKNEKELEIMNGTGKQNNSNNSERQSTVWVEATSKQLLIVSQRQLDYPTK